MKTKFSKYNDDLKNLIDDGNILLQSIKYQCFPEKYKKVIETLGKKDKDKALEKLNGFRDKYQIWYSEALILIKQLLPDRLNNFVQLYERPKNRKKIDYENYVIEDYIQGLSITNGYTGETTVGLHGAIPKFEQQLNILKSVEKRFESSLFDINQLLQADLFDNELDAAKELCKKGFLRGAGAIAGVVLEEHFLNICNNHKLILKKKNPGINDFNDLLKSESMIEIDIFRFIQRLGDLRNKCDHKKSIEPTKEDIEELINGVDKIIKTVF